MLKLSEEIVLMALDENGSFAPMTEGSLEIAVAGALLIELSFMGRLDSDSVNMRVSDRSDTGSLALNKALELIPPEQNLTIKKALAAVAQEGEEFVHLALESLTVKGVLRKVDEKFLWVLSERRYPVFDNRPAMEVRERIRRIISDESEIPTPHDIVIVALADCCQLLTTVFQPEELQKFRERINAISHMDFIAREVCREAQEVRQAILKAIELPNY